MLRQQAGTMLEGLKYLQNPKSKTPRMVDFLLTNWAELLLALMVTAKVVVNLTPTEKDNKVFAYVDLLINAIISDRKKR